MKSAPTKEWITRIYGGSREPALGSSLTYSPRSGAAERTASLAQEGHESPRRLFRRGTWSLSRRWSSRDGLYRGDRGPVFYGPAGIRAAVR